MSAHKSALSAHRILTFLDLFQQAMGIPFPLPFHTLKTIIEYIKFHKMFVYERSQHMTPHNIHFASVYTNHMG
jgi:predicted phosphatase